MNTTIIFNIYIAILVLYAVYVIVQMFSSSLAKKLFILTNILFLINSILYVIYAVQTRSASDIFFSIVMICFVGVAFFFYFWQSRQQEAPRVHKGIFRASITPYEDWVQKNLKNKNFEKQLERKLRQDKRFGRGWVYKKDEERPSNLKDLIIQQRLSKLRQQRTLDTKINDLTVLAQLRSQPDKQEKIKDALLQNPTFVQQLVDKKQTIVDDLASKPIRKEQLEKMLDLFPMSRKQQDQLQDEFFGKLRKSVIAERDRSMKTKSKFDFPTFRESFLKQIDKKDPSIWLSKTAVLEKKSIPDLLDDYVKDTLKTIRQEQRSVARSVARSRRPTTSRKSVYVRRTDAF